MNGRLGIVMPKVILDQPQVVAALGEGEAAGRSKQVLACFRFLGKRSLREGDGFKDTS